MSGFGGLVWFLVKAALLLSFIGLAVWLGTAAYEALSLEALVAIAVVLLIVLVLRNR